MLKQKESYESSEIYRIRHSMAHVLAEAVISLFKPGEAKIAIGPPIQDGFYYDFELPRSLTADDLEVIETLMRQIISQHHSFVKKIVSAEEAKKIFANQPYKLELIHGLEIGGYNEDGEPLKDPQEISIFSQDTFTDLCRGPHVEHTGKLNPSAFKLLNVAGAYWRGDENNTQLQRIYGTAWESEDQLLNYLWRLDEAKKRDHRKLGRDLDLFSTNEDVGSGLVLWHPKGGMVRKIIEDFMRAQHEMGGYEFVYSPHIGKAALWNTSGHLDWYADNMYSPMEIDNHQYYLKPMNCPFHIHIFKSRTRSYRDLPLRFAEWGTVYRYERSGVLHGLLRVRGFTQDDAHLFCRPDQMPDEIDRVLAFSLNVLRQFGFQDFKAYLSTRNPDKFAGEISDWEAPTHALRRALDRAQIPYEIDPGEAVFYGPKIDIKVKDALDREWQLSTIQFDFILPERFDIWYIGNDGKEHRPYMIHRALMGSMERFFGVLIEHFEGAFPVWLAPIQATLIPIADRHIPFSEAVRDQLQEAGLRIEVDKRSERMNAKIRDAQGQKIPYMLIIGDREIAQNEVALRRRNGTDLGSIPITSFINLAKQEISDLI